MSDKEIQEVAHFLYLHKPWLVLTGAGISTESGIPDFRTPGKGLWEQYNHMEILSREVLTNKPEIFYKVGFRILWSFQKAQPNQAHFTLTEWEKRGWIVGVVTQNIDSLHTKAGSRQVMEIHGHLRSASCLRCHQVFPVERLVEKVEKGEIPPRCLCGGVMRPDVVLFGDMLPPCFEEAVVFAHRYPLLVVGSSLQVSPANFLPSYASRLVIVNLGETPFDRRAQWVLRGKASFILHLLHQEMLRLEAVKQ
ncbi:MAG: SIR2 family NAD-dependent protein deacylase [Candidatus Caldatribacteriaceae bacterium]